MVSLCSVLLIKLTEYIPSTFVICHAGVSFSIKLAAFQASGWAET
jgi:hypothetical protein